MAPTVFQASQLSDTQVCHKICGSEATAAHKTKGQNVPVVLAKKCQPMTDGDRALLADGLSALRGH